MENRKREIAKFYEQIFLDAKLKERLEEKLKEIANEEDFRKLIREEIMPLMKKFKVNFSEEALLEYEQETLKKLSKETLTNVSGGISIKSALLTGGLLSMALLGGVSLSASAMDKEPPALQAMQMVTKSTIIPYTPCATLLRKLLLTKLVTYGKKDEKNSKITFHYITFLLITFASCHSLCRFIHIVPSQKNDNV